MVVDARVRHSHSMLLQRTANNIIKLQTACETKLDAGLCRVVLGILC